MDEGSTSTIAAAERHIIERPRLTKILDESNARLILLVAPAGYGKTTLARQWLRDKPHVWYQATPASADPVALATRLERLFRSPSASELSIPTSCEVTPRSQRIPDDSPTCSWNASRTLRQGSCLRSMTVTSSPRRRRPPSSWRSSRASSKGACSLLLE